MSVTSEIKSARMSLAFNKRDWAAVAESSLTALRKFGLPQWAGGVVLVMLREGLKMDTWTALTCRFCGVQLQLRGRIYKTGKHSRVCCSEVVLTRAHEKWAEEPSLRPLLYTGSEQKVQRKGNRRFPFPRAASSLATGTLGQFPVDLTAEHQIKSCVCSLINLLWTSACVSSLGSELRCDVLV